MSIRLGRVKIGWSYVVDLDDEEMIRQATDALYEDLMNAVKYDELHLWIDHEEDDEATEEDIAGFLRSITCPECNETVLAEEFDDEANMCNACLEDKAEEN